MNIYGLTLGTGPWEPVANAAATAMRRATGIEELAVVTRVDLPRGVLVPHPSWWKLWAFDLLPPDADAVLYFDADVIALTPWCPRSLLESADGCLFVGDRPELPEVRNEAEAYGIAPARYVNAGMWVLHRSHRGLLDAAKPYAPQYGRWLEQTALNRALALADSPHFQLPRAYNTLVPGPAWPAPETLRAQGIINAHLCTPHAPQAVLDFAERVNTSTN